jgi:hypothetical protein
MASNRIIRPKASSTYSSPASSTRLLDDHRFRALLSDQDWGRLPLAVWRRFSKRLADGATIVYVGEIDEVHVSRAGWWLAQAARAIGGPLPLVYERGAPMIVAVTEDASCGGQTWTRICARASGFPQVIHSCKRFEGPTGLEEYVGFGVSMALTISVVDEAMCFSSAGYAFQLGRLRLPLPLPRWLTPGDLTVTHRDLGEGCFRFTLDVIHPRLGRLIRQSAVFREATS